MINIPLYKYKCVCEQEFEVLTSIANYQSTHICPECGEMAKRNVKDLASRFRGDKDFYDTTKLK